MIVKDLNEKFTDVLWSENTIRRITDRLEKMKKGDLMVDLNDLYKDNAATLRRIANYENQIILANQKIENLVNVLEFEKIELDKNIDGRIDIMQIVDKGKVKLESIMGPTMPDSKGRLPGDPHHGHNH